MTKKLVVAGSLLAKSQVAAFTRKDGTVVQSHDNGRQAAAPKPAAGRPAPAPGDVGHEEHQQYGVHFKKGDKVKDRYGKSHDVLSHHGPEVKTASGESFHPTKLFHADGGNLAAAPKPKRQLKVKAPAAPAHTPDPHHSDLEEGDELLDEKGQKHEYSATHRGIGRMQVEMRSGHKVPTGSDGKLSGWKKTGRNNVTGAGHEPHPAAAKTGSAAPAKMKNVGTDKWPLHAKSSDALGSKHPDGSTHHVGGFEPPAHGKGDHLIHHDGKTFGFSGKKGKNMKTGEDSYEYSAGDTGEHRAWVTRSGHLQND